MKLLNQGMSYICIPPLPRLKKKCGVQLDSNSYLCSSLLCRANGADPDPPEPVNAEEPVLAKKPPKEQRVIKEMQFVTTDEFSGVPA